MIIPFKLPNGGIIQPEHVCFNGAILVHILMQNLVQPATSENGR
jgi:hypothetical protein